MLISSTCFAEWRKCPEFETIDEFREILPKIDKEFIIPMKKSNIGFLITAISSDESSMIQLRYKNDYIDYSLNMLQPKNHTDCDIYIDLLDEDEFLLKTVFISPVEKEYTGKLVGKFNMKWEEFSKIKYYHLNLRDQ
jgi:hypothetical protein